MITREEFNKALEHVRFAQKVTPERMYLSNVLGIPLDRVAMACQPDGSWLVCVTQPDGPVLDGVILPRLDNQ